LLGQYCNSVIVYLHISEVIITGQREGRLG
jgi:hypothetical protein